MDRGKIAVASFLRLASLLSAVLGAYTHLDLGRETSSSSFKFYFRLEESKQRDSFYQHRHVTVEFHKMILFQASGEPLLLYSFKKAIRSQRTLK